jgi:hypothetical protein
MATHFFGLNSGLTATVDLRDISTTDILNDIEESITQGNIIIALTQGQYNNLFDVCAGTGKLLLETENLKTLIADCVNNSLAAGTFSYRAGSVNGATVQSSYTAGGSSLDNYNLSDFLSGCRTYLRPSTYINDIKDTFIATSLGATEADISGAMTAIRTKYTELGFFTDFENSFNSFAVSGDDSNHLTSADVTLNEEAFTGGNDVALFKAIGDAGYLSTSLDGTSLNLEDGFAIHMTLIVSGSTTMTVKYSADTSIVSGSPVNDLIGVLAGTVTEQMTKTLGQSSIRDSVIGGGGGEDVPADGVKIPVLLMKVT